MWRVVVEFFFSWHWWMWVCAVVAVGVVAAMVFWWPLLRQ